MEMLLIAVTLVSLVLALAMSVVAWRATHAEKLRAAARAAALAAAAGEPEYQSEPLIPAARPEPAAAPWRTPAVTRVEPVRDEVAPMLVEPVAPGSVSVQASFLGTASPIRESQEHQHWLRIAAAVVAIVLAGAVFVRMSHRGDARTTAHAQAAPPPLELLSLRHERQGVNLSVAGLVRNPQAGAVLERVTAVVYLFDQQGAFVTSAKAPIDFLKLTAGDESPFVVKVAAPTTVARYRVSFRTDDGTLAHVDRRGEPPASTPVALTRSEK